ncbi:MAG: hypothetical protein QNJ29_08325 [Rhizobiaceae bacterium]|nr:hypothetical protein [Rhizobiaceae bacterium]
MRSLVLLLSSALLALGHFSFFSEESVPNRWKDKTLKGHSRTEIRTILGTPDAVENSAKSFDEWHMESSPYWTLKVLYDKNNDAEFAVYYRVYPNEQIGKKTQLW